MRKGAFNGSLFLCYILEWLPLAVKHPVNHPAVSFVHFALVKVYVYIGDSVIPVTESVGDSVLWNVKASGYRCPRVASPVGTYLWLERVECATTLLADSGIT